MKIVEKIKNMMKTEKKEGLTLEELGDFLGGYGINIDNIDNSSDLSETIYYICLKHLSDTMSKMPWELRVLTEKKGKEKDYKF
ncbi:hypothetical protein [Cetobacterium sp. 2A]|uniref:hypothetical protein n=1 Tax=Cetobacterium sp. 2A TaxID=2754723 RepID=UPI00210632C6|nr:hypothetical protein [Cetobacterium sp. 2A]